jgi:hypothetical protein
MIKTLLDREADARIRILVSACIVAIAITLGFASWRIQLASVAIREFREYTVRRDNEVWPIVREIRDNVQYHREFMKRVDEHLDRQQAELTAVLKAIEKVR